MATISKPMVSSDSENFGKSLSLKQPSLKVYRVPSDGPGRTKIFQKILRLSLFVSYFCCISVKHALNSLASLYWVGS